MLLLLMLPRGAGGPVETLLRTESNTQSSQLHILYALLPSGSPPNAQVDFTDLNIRVCSMHQQPSQQLLVARQVDRLVTVLLAYGAQDTLCVWPP